MVQHVFSILSGAADDEIQHSADEDAISEIDARILRLLEFENPLGHNYDLITGYVGIGVYLLERLPRREAMLGIERTLDLLENISENSQAGITWFTPPSLIPPLHKKQAPFGYYNLGVAHGVPGVVAFLVRVATSRLSDTITRKTSRLLDGAMKWLLAQQRPLGSISRYSSWIAVGQDGEDSRMAWCYGDLGIAAIFQFAGRRMQNPLWLSAARSLSDQCLLRQSNEVADAALCHGAFGIAHIYNRIYQHNREDIFKQTTLDWIHRGLALRKQGVGIAGYYAYNPSSTPPECRDASFLSGAVGIALALLAAITPIEPQWDRIMLLSGVRPLNN